MPAPATAGPPATRPCPVCSSEDVAGYNADYLRCAACEAIYYYKIPSEAELVEVYGGNFLKRLRRKLMAPFRKLHHRTTTFQERERNGGIFQRTMELTGIDSGRFLDIGCNRGFLLEAAKDAGWDVWGIEFSPEQIQPFRNSYPELADQVRAGGFLELSRDLPDEHFQVITAIDVVEHFLRPVDCFREIHRVLAPGGKFLVQTPSSKLPDAQRDGPAWGELKPAEHMQIFTPENLLDMCRPLGFTGLEVAEGAFDHPDCNFVGVLSR